MGRLLGDYQLEHGLTDDQLAVLLTERLGSKIRAPITAKGVANRKLFKDENLPSAWLEVLQIERPKPDYSDLPDFPEEPADAPTEPTGGKQAGRGKAKEEKSPGLEVFPVFDRKDAREALIQMHKGVGKLVARFRDDREFIIIFDRAAPILADDWLDVAQVNPGVAKLLQTLTFGGSAEGKLAFHYVALIYAVVTRRKPDESGQPAADFPGPRDFAPTSEDVPGAGPTGPVDAARTSPTV